MQDTNAVESSASYGTNLNLLSCLIPQFLAYRQFECSFSTQTIQKYEGCLKQVVRDIGDIPIEQLDMAHIAILKQKMFERGSGPSWVATTTYVKKHLLRFAKVSLGARVMDPLTIKPPKRPSREVVYLSKEEIQRFINSIKLENSYKGKKRGKFLNVDGLRFRALVELLLGSTMRISETLALNRDSIDWDNNEIKIVGKATRSALCS